MKKPKIVIVGSSNTDMIIKMERIPEPGETVIGGEFSIAAGGKGANQAVAAARAGGEVNFVACVGKDMFGKQAVEGFIKDGINVEYVFEKSHTASGVALIFVDKKGENSIAVASGANSKLLPSHIERAKNAIISADVLIMQLETPIATVNAAAKLASANRVKVILNPAPARPLEAETLRYISILTPNKSEAELLTGIKVEDEKGADEAANALLSRGLQTVLITLGPGGVYVATSDMRKMVPGFEVEAVDTTAAGDVFNGALAVSLAENNPWLEAVRFANAAAALSVTKLGAQPSAPYRAEIEKFLKKPSLL
ncbi:MAG: ribokinase [bacterium]